MKPYKDLEKSYINGEWKDGAGTQQADVINPYSQKNIFTFQTASESNIDKVP